MEYLSYLIKFFYRIRWWLLIIPILLTVLAVFSTKHIGRTYNVRTTIYTGIISGYSVESTSTGGPKVDMVQQNTTMDNILNIITSESTLKKVSLRLYAQNMMHGDIYHDNNYIQATTYKELLRITPREVQKLIDRKDEKKTIAQLQAYEKPNSKNFIFGLFNWFHPDYSKKSLEDNIKVNRIGNSDMIEISYSNGDPGITYNTLKILNEEFTEQYQELRFGETNEVIKFYEEELAKLSKRLRISEDSLTMYNVKNKIINYDEQTKQLTLLNNDSYIKYENSLLDYNSARVSVNELEKRIQNHIITLKNNGTFINKLQDISDLTAKIAEIEALKNYNLSSKEIETLKSYKNQLKKSENDFTNFSEAYSNQKASKEGVSNDAVVATWLEELIKLEKAKAQIQVMEERKSELDQQYAFYSPVGSVLKRKERDINFTEQNYLSMLNSLNTAKLRQKNLQMTSATLKVINPPIYPISSEATKRRSVIMVVFFGSILLIIGFFLIIEIIDRTLRDVIRTERLTSCKVLGAFPGNEIVRFRNFAKIRNQIATRFLSNAIFCYLPSNKVRIVNLLSTVNNDGKTFIGNQLEEYWTSIGLTVKHLTWHQDFNKDSKELLLAQSLKELNKDKNIDIYLVEYPPLNECIVPTNLLNEASLNLVITRANRTWTFTDQLLLNRIKQLTDTESPVFIYLNKAKRDVVENFTGLLPPYSKLKYTLYKFSQFGLTASE